MFDHFDPQRINSSFAQSFSRLLHRGLTSSGTAAPTAMSVFGDLSVDAGHSNEDFTEWTFTLRSGVRFDDGLRIVAAHVKHGIERGFSTRITGGPSYYRGLITDSSDYEGPFDGRHLAGIEVRDEQTIIFRLTRSAPDFSWLLASSGSAPVPPDRDTIEKYDRMPLCSGPYRLASEASPSRLVVERNPYWNRSFDTLRAALPNGCVVLAGYRGSEIDEILMSDTNFAQTTVMLGSGLEPETWDRIARDPALRERLVTGTTGCTRLIAINNRLVPNAKVRQALHFATDRASFRTARGLAHCELASTVLSPVTPGYVGFDVFAASPGGDIDRARQLLRGVDFQEPLTLAFPNNEVNRAGAEALMEGYRRIPLDVVPVAVDNAHFSDYTAIRSNASHLTLTAWCCDYPSAASVIVPLLHSRSIRDVGNTNLAEYSNTDIDRAIDSLSSSSSQSLDHRWGDIDRRAMQDSPYIPLVYSSAAAMHGSRVRGAFIHPLIGTIDAASLRLELD